MITSAVFGGGGDGGDAQVGFPKQVPVGVAVAVGVEGINRVMHCEDKHDVARAFAWNVQVVDDQRLGIDVAVHRVAEQFAEAGDIDVRQGQKRFVCVLPLACVVVVVGEHRHARDRQSGE